MANYFKCLGQAKMNISTCLPVMTNSCLSSTVVAAKVIRLRMDLVKYIIEAMPSNVDFKVIHLIRDPRGILVSRKKGSLGNSTKYSAERNEAIVTEKRILSDSLCRQILVNINMEKELKKEYPNVFLQIRYEHLAMHTLQALREIYAFTGLQLTDRMEANILSRTHAPRGDGPIGTFRSNSTRTALHFKDTMGKTMQAVVKGERHCKALFKHFEEHDSEYL